MKQLFYIFLIGFLFTQCSQKTTAPMVEKEKMVKKENFRSQAPVAGAARKIQLGKAETFELDNGLTVIVVENHKLPTISYQLSLKNQAMLEGEKAGFTQMTGQLLNTGTTTKSKADIDNAIDYIGANFNTSGFGFFASSLKKHQGKLLDIVTDVLYNPTFPQEEFDKSKKQAISGLAAAKSDPNNIASNVIGAVLYGKDHPYGEIQTEESLNKISPADCKAYYEDFFRPNNAYLTIVGDITLEEAKSVANKYFKKWERKPVKNLVYNKVVSPSETKVAFAHKEGAVQSVIHIVNPIDLKPGDPDAIKASVMNGILGGGVFSGRLMQNLREDKAYTYGARSSVNTDPIIGSFRANASVRNEVTDSSVVQFLYELNRMRDEPVAADDLQLVKNYMTGSFARSLESPQTIARFALNSIRYNLPADYYDTYLQKLDAVSVADIQAMAQKYIQPKNAYIVVVGNKDDVSENLLPFDADGKIDFYTPEGDIVIPAAKVVPEGLTANDVVQDYLAALGGVDKLRSIKALSMETSLEAMGQKMYINVMQKAPGKMAMSVGNGQMVFQEQKFDGVKGQSSQMGQSSIVTEGPEFESMKDQAVIFKQLAYDMNGTKLELKGIEDVEGVSCYKIAVEKSNGDKSTEYYNIETSLLQREVSSQEGPGGQTVTIINDFMNYKDNSGVKFPYTMKVAGMMPVPVEMVVEELKVNPELSDDLFMVKE